MEPVNQHAALGYGVMAGAIVFILVVQVLIQIFFAWSMYKLMKVIPEEKRIVPAYLPWFIIIPFIGYIFSWIVVPFGVPNSAKAAATNGILVKKSQSLFFWGLVFMVCTVLALIPLIGPIFVLVSFILWIAYWIKVVGLRKAFERQTNGSILKPTGQ